MLNNQDKNQELRHVPANCNGILVVSNKKLAIGGGCEINLATTENDGELRKCLDAIKPVADAIAHLGLETTVILEVGELRSLLNFVGDQRHQRTQRKHLTEENDVPELDHQLHVRIKDVGLLSHQDERSLGLESSDGLLVLRDFYLIGHYLIKVKDTFLDLFAYRKIFIKLVFVILEHIHHLLLGRDNGHNIFHYIHSRLLVGQLRQQKLEKVIIGIRISIVKCHENQRQIIIYTIKDKKSVDQSVIMFFLVLKIPIIGLFIC
jgi:hypothetical protein